MIISTSSHNVQLTDDICAYVEKTLRSEFGRVAGDVVSIDARLEAVRDGFDMQATVHVNLRNHRAHVTEIMADNLFTAIRRGAADSARAVNRELEHARKITGPKISDTLYAFGYHAAPNI